MRLSSSRSFLTVRPTCCPQHSRNWADKTEGRVGGGSKSTMPLYSASRKKQGFPSPSPRIYTTQTIVLKIFLFFIYLNHGVQHSWFF